jgi:hypothetical protein
MSATGLFKRAVSVWAKAPGLPFTVSGNTVTDDRLLGMSEWAPRDMIERLSKGQRRGTSTDQLIQEERDRGLGGAVGGGAALGGLGGGILGRIVSGEAATAPIKDLFQEGTGTSLRGLRSLSRIPGAAKALTLGGLGIGALAGGIGWGRGAQDREDTARDIAAGLYNEQLAAGNAGLQNQVMARQLLNANPMPSATASSPLVAQTGKSV